MVRTISVADLLKDNAVSYSRSNNGAREEESNLKRIGEKLKFTVDSDERLRIAFVASENSTMAYIAPNMPVLKLESDTELWLHRGIVIIPELWSVHEPAAYAFWNTRLDNYKNELFSGGRWGDLQNMKRDSFHVGVQGKSEVIYSPGEKYARSHGVGCKR